MIQGHYHFTHLIDGFLDRLPAFLSTMPSLFPLNFFIFLIILIIFLLFIFSFIIIYIYKKIFNTLCNFALKVFIHYLMIHQCRHSQYIPSQPIVENSWLHIFLTALHLSPRPPILLTFILLKFSVVKVTTEDISCSLKTFVLKDGLLLCLGDRLAIIIHNEASFAIGLFLLLLRGIGLRLLGDLGGRRGLFVVLL